MAIFPLRILAKFKVTDNDKRTLLVYFVLLHFLSLNETLWTT